MGFVDKNNKTHDIRIHAPPPPSTHTPPTQSSAQESWHPHHHCRCLHSHQTPRPNQPTSQSHQRGSSCSRPSECCGQQDRGAMWTSVRISNLYNSSTYTTLKYRTPNSPQSQPRPSTACHTQCPKQSGSWSVSPAGPSPLGSADSCSRHQAT